MFPRLFIAGKFAWSAALRYQAVASAAAADRSASRVIQRQIKLSRRIICVCRFSVKLQCLCRIARNPRAFIVEKAEIVLRAGMFSSRGFSIPLRRFGSIALHAEPEVMAEAQRGLRVGLAGGRFLAKPRDEISGVNSRAGSGTSHSCF